MNTPHERDDDAQPNYREQLDEERREFITPSEHEIRVPPIVKAGGIIIRGNWIQLRAAKHWGSGSLVEIYPECPRCGRTWPEPYVNPFFVALWKFAFDEERTIYGQFKTCESCLANVDAESEAGKAENRARQLQACGFSTVNLAWSFDTYPAQGSPWLRRAKQYVTNPQHDIVIYGAPGVGKTGLAVAILKALWLERHSVQVMRASEMILSLRGANAEATQAMLRRLVETQFLLLDDLSALRRTEFFEEVLNVVVDIRQNQNRPTIITANVRMGNRDDPAEILATFFGHVAYDRLVERGEFWQMKGTSGRVAYGDQNRAKEKTTGDRWSPKGDE